MPFKTISELAELYGPRVGLFTRVLLAKYPDIDSRRRVGGSNGLRIVYALDGEQVQILNIDTRANVYKAVNTQKPV